MYFSNSIFKRIKILIIQVIFEIRIKNFLNLMANALINLDKIKNYNFNENLKEIN